MTSDTLLALDAVSKRFGATVTAERVSLALRRGEFFTLLGPSGSGKSTILRMIAGLEEPDEGRVLLHDADITQVPPWRRGLGMVFQQYANFPHMDVAANVAYGLRRRRMSAEERRRRVGELLSLVGLSGFETRSITQLSGGEQQRVAIARALLTNPRLLLMDEPLSSLDAQRKNEILHYIAQLPERFDLPILYVTHSVDEVAYLADRVLLMGEGRVAGHGTVQDVLDDVRSWAFTGGRHAAGSVLEARVRAHVDGLTELDVGGQTLRVPQIGAAPGTVARLRVPARDVVVATVEPTHLSIRNRLAARILSIEADETIYVELLLDVGAQHLRARITRHALEELGLAPDQAVYALIKSVALDQPLA